MGSRYGPSAAIETALICSAATMSDAFPGSTVRRCATNLRSAAAVAFRIARRPWLHRRFHIWRSLHPASRSLKRSHSPSGSTRPTLDPGGVGTSASTRERPNARARLIVDTHEYHCRELVRSWHFACLLGSPGIVAAHSATFVVRTGRRSPHGCRSRQYLPLRDRCKQH
jgi:hypothetical protein